MAGPSPRRGRFSSASGTGGTGLRRFSALLSQSCNLRHGIGANRSLTAYRYAVKYRLMIRSFGDKRTAALFHDERVRQFAGIARVAKRKLEAVHAASRLEDLTIPPSNRLEKLKGDLKDFYSIRINDQWRVIFKWTDGEHHEVRIVDYH
jgi:proteic killer suppression protein